MAFIPGTPGPDTLSGTDAVDTILGYGADIIEGGSGNDDNVIGKTGADTLFGGEGDDYAFAGYEGEDLIFGGSGSESAFIGGEGADSIYGGSGSDSYFYGGFGDDVISGDYGNRTFEGDAGDDTLIGGAGIDTVEGDSGNDVFMVESQGDFASYFYDGGAGTDTLVQGKARPSRAVAAALSPSRSPFRLGSLQRASAPRVRIGASPPPASRRTLAFGTGERFWAGSTRIMLSSGIARAKRTLDRRNASQGGCDSPQGSCGRIKSPKKQN